MDRRTVTVSIRDLALRLALIGVGTLVALLLAEITLRVFNLAPSRSIGTATASDFERIPGLFTPGQDIVDRQKPPLPFRVRINSLGYRGEDFARVAAPDEFRILMIGDSFTFGDFVDDEQTLPARLEALLRPSCGNVTVINAGVGGTTIIAHTEMAKRALSLEPDVVILTFYENDVSDLETALWYRLADNRERKSRFPFSIFYPVFRETALWNFALRTRATLATYLRESDVRPSERAATPEPPRTQEQPGLRSEYSRRLAQLDALLEEQGLPLVLAAFPSHHSVTDPDVPEQMAWVLATGQALGLRTVSYLPALRGSGRPIDELFLLPHDGHPSPLGYEITAAALLNNVDWPTLTDGRCAL